MLISILRRYSRITPSSHFLSPTSHLLFSTTTTTTTTSSTTPPSSDLYLKYSFKPPPSLHPKPKNPSFHTEPNNGKKKKPPYRPSSLDRSGKAPIHSDLQFDVRFSYTESSPTVRSIGLREPKYSPFEPGRIDREWAGVCALAADPMNGTDDAEKMEEKRRKMRQRIQGEELTEAERKVLVESCHKYKTNRQINLGRDGLTHNMLNDIHNNWKHSGAVRIRCMGVPTVDMKNVCNQLEDKAFGKIIHRHGGLLVLYRGRNYNPTKRPVIPLMLWKPHEPKYPRLIKTTIEGLSIGETKEMRKRGLACSPLTRLAKNGYYGSLVPMVRVAFLAVDLVRIDCRGLERKDHKKIGCKLRDLVPCILVTFDKEQIVIWRGKDYNPNEGGCFLTDRETFDSLGNGSAIAQGPGACEFPADDDADCQTDLDSNDE